jgi:hypothetical protein
MNEDKTVSLDKTYASDGERVRLLCTDRQGSANGKPVVGVMISNGNLRSWYLDGSFKGPDHPHHYDLMEVSPFEGWAIDEPVWVRRESHSKWSAAHFAGVSEFGAPTVFQGGRTSHTAAVVSDKPVAAIRRASEFSPDPWNISYE